MCWTALAVLDHATLVAVNAHGQVGAWTVDVDAEWSSWKRRWRTSASGRQAGVGECWSRCWCNGGLGVGRVGSPKQGGEESEGRLEHSMEEGIMTTGWTLVLQEGNS